jgi:hypothetical protein
VTKEKEAEMGRTYILHKRLFNFAFIAALGLAAPKVAMPYANAASAQTVPAIALNPASARDANTFESDKTLVAACQKSGQNKTVCICLTHVMKYEMSLTTYRAATHLYGQPADRSALHRKLQAEGYKASEIKTAENMERSLITAADFAPRCANAKAYYLTPKR